MTRAARNPLSRPRIDPVRLGRIAVASLHAELTAAPKPGLVTPFDTGSHDDMDAATFMRSLFALRGYYVAIARAGADGAPFTRLQRLGIDAEAAMNRATRGVNTHRGAIFSLGLLAAAAASLDARGGRLSADAVCSEVASLWKAPILAAQESNGSHGQLVARRFAAGGARREAAEGFPALRTIAVPALRHALAAGAPRGAAMAHTLMTLVAATEDTNLLYRGGADGLAFAQRRASEFLRSGGVFAPGWYERLELVAGDFVVRRLSPGGSADLLACAFFLLRVERTVQ